MYNIKNYEYDCTRKCRCRAHGNRITAALTKRSISDEKLSAFIAKTCCNYLDIVDDLGRSAVHLAASLDRYAILQWLLNQGAIINGREYESGSSALHRAIFYGCIDCAVLLLRYGASPDLLDGDTRCAYQNVCRLCDFSISEKVPDNNDILVWGSNKNYNLGIGNEAGTDLPQSLDFFRKEHISIEQVALGAYHSLFLDSCSRLYAVGHGKGGRLGIGIESSLPVPKKVKVPIKNAGEIINCISVSRNHSLVLTNQSAVYACGLNEDHQLGVRDAGESLSVLKEVVTLRNYGATDLVRVIARDFHSLAYSEKCVYIWGTNYGQFGLEASVKALPLPKLMKLPNVSISLVECNNFATAILTKDKTILLYHNNKMNRLNPPNYEALKSISVIGGENTRTSKGNVTALKLFMLTETNVIFLWYENTKSFLRCIFSHIRISQIDKIFYKANQIFVLSQGDVYKGKCHQIPAVHFNDESQQRSRHPTSVWSRNDHNRTEVSTDHVIRIDLQRLTSVDRAVDIFCDENFSSFAVLQESHMKYFKLPTITAEEYSFKKLYNDANEGDAVHDVVFHVDSETFPAHKFIIYSRAPGLREVISAYKDKHIYLNYDRLTAKMFELMLKFMYCNTFPNEIDIDDIQQSLGPESPADRTEVCQLFLEFVEKFQLNNLSNFLKTFLEQQPVYLLSKYRISRLHRKLFPSLYDVRIVCMGDVELQAHKCVLVAHLEYFDMMFTHSWAEQTTINLSSVPVEYMQPIVDFLYNCDVEYFRKQKYSETFLHNMIVYCDQFFINQLRKVCEVLLLERITIRKCGDLLDFACMYNCEVLKHGCMEFICQNLARVLASKTLDNCEPEALKCLNGHYRKMFKDVFDYRMITPDSEAVDDDLLLSFVDDFHVDLDYYPDEQQDGLSSIPGKLKSKESKTKQFSKQYERDAISSMKASLNYDESSKSAVEDMSKIAKEAQEIANKLHAESKSWMKVVDKKDHHKKRLSLEHILKANETLKCEEKSKPELVSVAKSTESPTTRVSYTERETPPKPTESTSPAKVYSLNLSDFTPTREKLSQKQRKRLSSESSTSWRASASANTPTQPAVVSQSPPNAWKVQTPPSLQPNAWGVQPRSVPHEKADKNSFSQILADETKQRDYYERMRTKSLVLTQIEETAITELRQFYNVDNATDEIITIERKRMPRTMNFAVWQRN